MTRIIATSTRPYVADVIISWITTDATNKFWFKNHTIKQATAELTRGGRTTSRDQFTFIKGAAVKVA